MLKEAHKIMHLQHGTMAHRGHPNYVLARNERVFSKRVYTQGDKHTGESLPYMRSSIDLSFDGGNYMNLSNDFKPKDLQRLIVTSDNKGKFSAPKDQLKAQNHPRPASDLGKSFYDQQLAPPGVRRFVENSEGDSIFNYDKDMHKKAKNRKKLGEAPRESFYKD